VAESVPIAPTAEHFEEAVKIRTTGKGTPGAPLKGVREALRILRDEPSKAPREFTDRINAYEESTGKTVTPGQRKAARIKAEREAGRAEVAATTKSEAVAASTETQLIGEENAVNRAASLIREGKSVKAVFSALTEGLGRNLKPKEFDILTKAVLEKGAESPKK
jgi:hypothetical protein